MPEKQDLARQLRQTIDDFLANKLAKESKNPTDELKKKFSRPVWVSDKAQTANKEIIQKNRRGQPATHIIKGVHSGAKGSNLLCLPQNLPQHTHLVGSHLLSPDCDKDIAINATYLDLGDFLMQKYQNKTLLQWMQDEKQAVITALGHPDAANWVDIFCDVLHEPETLATHTLAKQVYWLEGNDPTHDDNFVLLAPLYASSLAHVVHTEIQEDCFGESAETARDDRQGNKYSEHVLHEYPNLAVQKLGGANPRNVSLLNNKRNGINYLFSSCPPSWRSRQIRPIFYQESVFSVFEKHPAIQKVLTKLRQLLEKAPKRNAPTRKKRDAYILTIIGNLRQYVEELLSLTPGWTSDNRCHLADEERCWLDPFATAKDPDFSELWTDLNWAPEIERRFANWLNSQLRQNLPMGDDEHTHWASLFDNRAWRQMLKHFYCKVADDV